ncbi:MAG TPA: 30S ribosomal protein S4 [Candidatus Eisenbacteria bacterium]|jgi:small subunit ribosomal protein S4|nr:30S ribosomal protein S4 [Candidatus Eisenbacteria bacterium]
MAVYHDARCRLCRREGIKLFLKGDRCFSDKCAIERRGYAPGEHGKSRRAKETNYGLQLREKQKARRIYGVLERQFRATFAKAERQKGVTGVALLQALECRVDSVLYRLGLAPSRSAARQLVRHRHVEINGKTMSIPSFVMKPGQTIGIREKSRNLPVVQAALEKQKGRGTPDWLELDTDAFRGRVLQTPSRESIQVPVNEQLIVELYSK